MAGTFTHWLIADNAKENRDILPEELRMMLNRHHRFLRLGAVAPDIQYLCFNFGGPRWADHMHYTRTNQVPRMAFAELKAQEIRDPLWEERWIWLAGYVSHLVADAVVHPVVQAAVGPYQGNETAHRRCEMTQDALLYYDIKGDELTYGEYSELFRFAGESLNFQAIMTGWSRALIAAYPEETAKPNPSTWFSTYKKAIDAAEGGSGIVALFRHLAGDSIFYADSRDIQANHPEDKDLFYDNILLPDGRHSSFRNTVFEKATIHVAEVWRALWDGLATGGDFPLIICDWNLDTGVDQNSPGEEVTFWPRI